MPRYDTHLTLCPVDSDTFPAQLAALHAQYAAHPHSVEQDCRYIFTATKILLEACLAREILPLAESNTRPWVLSCHFHGLSLFPKQIPQR
ncbi:MAG: hypothetical protein LIO74_00595 [Ruminococcus sp.]|nr:hypothetical protein [Ruminococcus sp.]